MAERPSLRIFLARHGQTDWNLVRRMQGWTDIPLNDTGRVQAKELAAKVQGLVFDSVYCSELSRSRETATIVADGRPVVPLRQLNERCFGVFEGERLDFADELFLAEFRRRCTDPDDCLDSGESYRQHRARVEEAMSIIRERHPSGQVLIIGHGGTNQVILHVLLNLSKAELATRHQENSDVFVVELSEKPHLWLSLEEFDEPRSHEGTKIHEQGR